MLADAASPLRSATVAVGRAFASTECGRGIAFDGSFGGGFACRCGGGAGGNAQGAAVAATDADAAGAAGGGAPAAFDATETVGRGSGASCSAGGVGGVRLRCRRPCILLQDGALNLPSLSTLCAIPEPGGGAVAGTAGAFGGPFGTNGGGGAAAGTVGAFGGPFGSNGCTCAGVGTATDAVGRGLSNSAGGPLNRDFAAAGGGSATDAVGRGGSAEPLAPEAGKTS